MALSPISITSSVRKKRLPDDVTAIAQPDDGQTHIADSAGPTPTGAIGGQDVLDAARNRAETGQTQPTPVTESMTETGMVPGDLASTGEPTSKDATPNENPAMVPDAPETNIDDLYQQYAESTFAPVDTAAQEKLMQEQQDRLLGQNLVAGRARMGEAGFGMSGAAASLENTARADAARQLGLDVIDTRNEAERSRREAIEGAMGIDIEKQRAARQDAILQAQIEAMNRLVNGEGDGTGGEGGGEGEGANIGDVTGISTGTSPLGKGTDQSELAAPSDPSGYEERASHEGSDTFVENYTDPDSKTWSVYVTGDGKRYRVPMGK